MMMNGSAATERRPDRAFHGLRGPIASDQTLVEDRAHDEAIVRDRQPHEPDVDVARGERARSDPASTCRAAAAATSGWRGGSGAAPSGSSPRMLAMPNPIRRRPASPRAARCDSATVAAESSQQVRVPARRGGGPLRSAARRDSAAPAADRRSVPPASDPFAQRRLRDVQPLRRAAEVQRLGQGDDRREIGQVDVHNRRLSDWRQCFIGRH